MNSQELLRFQANAMHNYLEAAIHDCSPEILSTRLPGATISSPGAIYAHTIFGEDGLLHGLARGGTPVYYAQGWAQKIGIDMPQGGLDPEWKPTFDLRAFRYYAAAVYRETDAYLAGATAAELARVVEPGFVAPVSIERFVGDILLWHVATHQGGDIGSKGRPGARRAREPALDQPRATAPGRRLPLRLD